MALQQNATQIIEDDKRERDRARANELAVRERETQDLLKSGIATKKGTKQRGVTRRHRDTLICLL